MTGCLPRKTTWVMITRLPIFCAPLESGGKLAAAAREGGNVTSADTARKCDGDFYIIYDLQRAGSLIIGDNFALESLDGLRNLATIAGSLEIEFNEVLTSLAGLEKLTSIGEALSIRANRALPTSSAQALADTLVKRGFSGEAVISGNAGGG